MTETLIRMPDILVPDITPIEGTLLDVASIIEGITLANPDIGLFESFNCVTTDRRAKWPCPVTYLIPPVQAAAVGSTTGGTLAAGTYRFKVTAINAQGETLPSNEQSATTTGTTGKVTLAWAAVTGATGYVIYATDGAVDSEKFLVQVGNVLGYVWTGAPAIGTADPPAANTATDLLIKTFDAPAWPSGNRFTVYAGVDCKMVDGPLQLKELQRVYEARESYGVERGLIESTLQGATDITPAGGAVTPMTGLGLLEGDAATKYAGVPTIHLPRSLGTPLFSFGALEKRGKAYYTAQGSKVASGGGYVASNVGPAGTSTPAGELWVYASGEVVVQRSELIAKDALNTNTNDNLDLVERIYITTVDCYKSAIRVKVA